MKETLQQIQDSRNMSDTFTEQSDNMKNKSEPNNYNLNTGKLTMVYLLKIIDTILGVTESVRAENVWNSCFVFAI